MTPTLGTLERHPDGVFTGVMRTLMIRVQIELRPQPVVDGARMFDVFAGPSFLFGRGHQLLEPNSPINLRLNAPELPQPLIARLVHVEGGEWALLWLEGSDHIGDPPFPP